MRWRSAAPGRPPSLPADRVVADGRCPRPEPVMTKAFVTAIGARFEAHGVELVHFGNGLMSWADPSSVTLPRRWPATLARDPRCGEGGGADGELRAASTAAGPGRPTGPAGPMVARGGVDAVGADHAGLVCGRLARPYAAPGRQVRADVPTGRECPHSSGGGERGHSRSSADQPPPSAPGGLATARYRTVGAGRRHRLRVRVVRGNGPARRAAGRQLPGLVPQCHRRPLAGLQQLRPTAHPHRVATLAALAVVGRGRGGRDGRAHAGDGAGTSTAVSGVPDVREPAVVPALRGLVPVAQGGGALIVL